MTETFHQIAPNGVKNYKSNPNLKASGVSFVFSREQIEERIKCSKDPIYFIQKYMKIVHVDRGLVPFDLYDFQKTLLRSYIENRFTIAKLPRQVGKSTVTIGYILWTVLFGPMQNIAILANKASTARDILSKLQLAYEHIPMWMQQGIVSWNKGSIELENGSKVIAAATASSSARGNTYNCVDGNSITKIKIDDQEADVSLSELYEIIANSSKYKRRQFGDEVQYVRREQIQKTIHEDCDQRLFADAKCQDGETPYCATKSWWRKFSRKFSAASHSTSHSVSQIINKICYGRVQDEHDVCVCHDDSYETLSKNDESRVCISARLFTRMYSWAKTISGCQRQNICSQYGEIAGNSKDRRTSTEYIKRFNWIEKIFGARCQDQSKPRKNTKDGGEASWHETIRGIQTKDEFGSQGSNTLEQGEGGSIFARSFGKDASRQVGHTFDRGAQTEFEKIQVLTEKGYKNFHGIKKTASQDTIRLMTDAGEIICTPEHNVFTDIGYVEAKDCLGRSLYHEDKHFYEVTALQYSEKIDVYDLLEVEDTHSYYCNNFLVHQCIFLDEFAFVPKNIAEEFITSVYPTISSGKTTKVIMVSTPNGMNLFYKYWTDAINKRNLYVPIEAHWSVVPGRDAEWLKTKLNSLDRKNSIKSLTLAF